ALTAASCTGSTRSLFPITWLDWRGHALAPQRCALGHSALRTSAAACLRDLQRSCRHEHACGSPAIGAIGGARQGRALATDAGVSCQGAGLAQGQSERLGSRRAWTLTASQGGSADWAFRRL